MLFADLQLLEVRRRDPGVLIADGLWRKEIRSREQLLAMPPLVIRALRHRMVGQGGRTLSDYISSVLVFWLVFECLLNSRHQAPAQQQQLRRKHGPTR